MHGFRDQRDGKLSLSGTHPGHSMSYKESRGFSKFERELGEKRAACVVPVLTQATKPPDPE